MNVIDRIYEKINIEEGKKTIESFFLNLYLNDRMSTKELAQELLIPIPLVTAIKKEAIKENMVEQNSGIILSVDGKNFVENILGYKGINKKIYKDLIQNKSDIDIMESLYKDVETVFKNRPEANVILDQSKCTVKTAIERVLEAIKNNSIIGKKIVCVGDDDLISITICLVLEKLFKTKTYGTKIYVLDTDKRIINYINKISEMFEFSSIICKEIDLKKKLPNEIINSFDTAFTDPPYTNNGLILFVTRAIECLKKEVGLNIFLSFAHKSQDSMYKIENEILKLGLCIYHIIPNFNEYEGAEILGNKGQLIILKTTNYTEKTLNIDYDKPIYTGELRQTRRKYKCKNCGKEYWVGIEEKIDTIEQLKDKKCLICKENIFELVEKIKNE